jgi:hypothetical protein
VLVGGEKHPITVAALVGMVRQAAQADKIYRGIERASIVRLEASASQNLLGYGPKQRILQLRWMEGVVHPISLTESHLVAG